MFIHQTAKPNAKKLPRPSSPKGSDVTYIQLIDNVQLADMAPVLNAFVEANKTPNPLSSQIFGPGRNLALAAHCGYPF